jgi:hypothetical protein
VTRRRWTAIGALVAVVAAIWIAVASTGSDNEGSPSDRPERLLDLRPADITAIEANGHDVPLDEVRNDLAPLLAVRTLTSVKASYGLDPPAFVVRVHTRTRTYELRIGAYNFDKTAVYASVGANVGTILPSLAEHLASAAGLALKN